MTSKKNMTEKVNDVKEDIKIRNLDIYYGNSRNKKVLESYGFYHQNNIEKLAIYLRETKVPKYTILSNKLLELSSYYIEDLNKAITLLKHENYKGDMTDKEIKTTYKEFKKIERTSIKLKKHQACKLNKNQDFRYFVKYEYNIVLAKLINSNINLEDPNALIEFFDNCEELEFLNNSKTIKKLSKRN